MEFKDMIDNLEDSLDEASYTNPSQASGTATGGDRYTQMSGKDYAMGGPASTRITRSDKRNLYKSTDPEQVKSAVDSAFQMIIAATRGTPAASVAVSKINQVKKQIFSKLDDMKK